MAYVNIVGMKELQKNIKNLGNLPQKCVNKAAKSGANIPYKQAKIKAPFLSGALQKGIIIKGERKTVTGKKIYDVMMDPAMNDIFQKKHKAGSNNSKVRSGEKKVGENTSSYYPASQEFGYQTINGRYIPGEHFLRDAIVDNSKEIESKIVTVLSKEIDKELR